MMSPDIILFCRQVAVIVPLHRFYLRNNFSLGHASRWRASCVSTFRCRDTRRIYAQHSHDTSFSAYHSQPTDQVSRLTSPRLSRSAVFERPYFHRTICECLHINANINLDGPKSDLYEIETNGHPMLDVNVPKRDTRRNNPKQILGSSELLI